MELTLTYNQDANAFCSAELPLTGDCILRVRFADKWGRLAIRKSNTGEAPWPLVMMSPVTKDADVYIFGQAAGKHIRIETSEEVSRCTLLNA